MGRVKGRGYAEMVFALSLSTLKPASSHIHAPPGSFSATGKMAILCAILLLVVSILIVAFRLLRRRAPSAQGVDVESAGAAWVIGRYPPLRGSVVSQANRRAPVAPTPPESEFFRSG
jgi:hypothetical protein